MYNTCFWNLVNSGETTTSAEKILKGTLSSDKNELLFSRFNINYNNLPAIYRKGTTVYRSKTTKTYDYKTNQVKEETHKKPKVTLCHDDIIGDAFWDTNKILSNKNE